MAGVVVVLVAARREARHLDRHVVLWVAAHRVRDVVRAGRGRPPALVPRLFLVVADPHRRQEREADLRGVAPRLLGARTDVLHRPADRRLVDADVEHHPVGERAGDPEVLRPGRRHHDRHLRILLDPAEVDVGAVQLHVAAGDEIAENGDRVAQERRLHRVQAHRADGAVAAPDPQLEPPGMELRERREGARRRRHVPGERVRHRGADDDPLGRGERRGHVDDDVLPEDLGVDEPRVAVARLLRGLDGGDALREVLAHELGADAGHGPLLSTQGGGGKARSSARVCSSVFTWPQPTRIISSAGSCRCGVAVPTHSSTTIGW